MENKFLNSYGRPELTATSPMMQNSNGLSMVKMRHELMFKEI